MQLTQLDTRVPLSAEAPQINFNQLTADTLGLYDNIKQTSHFSAFLVI